MTIGQYQKKCVAQYKKTLYEGSELPQEELLDNLSEAIFSVAIAAHAFDVDLADVFKRSVEKIDKAAEERKSDVGDRKN